MAARADFTSDITERMQLVSQRSGRTSDSLGLLKREAMPFGDATLAGIESVKVLCMMAQRPEEEGGARKQEARDSASRILRLVEATRIPLNPNLDFVGHVLELLDETRTLFVRNVRWGADGHEEEADRNARSVLMEIRRTINNAKARS